MPLTASLSRGAFASNSLTGILNDSTVYGGSNPARAAVATYLKVYKLDKLGNKTAETVDTYDPETATSFTYSISKDGWFQGWFVIIQDYSGGTTYNHYDVVYNDANNTVYRSTSVTPIIGQAPPGANWEVISDPTTLIDNVGTSTASANLIYQVFDYVASPNTRTYLGNTSAIAADDCCSTCQRPEEVLDYELFGVLLDAMEGNGDRGYFASAEKNARKAQEVYEAL